MALRLEDKRAVVAEVKAVAETAQSALAAEYSGLTVSEMTELRKQAREQGYDVVAVNWRGLYVPGGVSDETFNAWADKLRAVAESEAWQQTMKDNGLAPFTKVGGDFQSWIDQVVADTEVLSRQIGVIQ